MRKTDNRDRPGFPAAQADARPPAVAYDPYFPVVASASGERTSPPASSTGHTLYDPFRSRRANRMEF